MKRPRVVPGDVSQWFELSYASYLTIRPDEFLTERIERYRALVRELEAP